MAAVVGGRIHFNGLFGHGMYSLASVGLAVGWSETGCSAFDIQDENGSRVERVTTEV